MLHRRSRPRVAEATSTACVPWPISSAIPGRSGESFIEPTHQAQLARRRIVQPDLQHVFTPAGGIASPLAPGQRIGHGLALGLHINVTF